MKLYISVDIEGVAGISTWDEATRWKPDYPPFREELMKELTAACSGANLSGAKEILVNDAHGVGRNIWFDGLPSNIKILRSVSGHPYNMMQGLDNTFDAALMIGYHSYAGSDRNPLAHTIDTDILYIKINGQYASELLINTYTAAYEGVPVVFVSGDFGICEEAKELNEYISVVATTEGFGEAVLSEHPEVIAKNIEKEVQKAIGKNYEICKIVLPNTFKVEISYVNHAKAFKASFYPGVNRVSSSNVIYESDNYFDVLRMLLFVL